MVTKARQNRVEQTAYDSSTWSGASITFTLQDAQVGEGHRSITFSRNSYPELYDRFVNRKNFEVDFSDARTPEDIEKLKQKILADAPTPSKENYDKLLADLNDTYKQEFQSYFATDIARAVTHDLADASGKGVSDARYANIVEYAKNVLKSVGTKTPLEDIKESGRGGVQKMFDAFLEHDSLQRTKRAIAQLKENELFFDDKQAQKVFGEMAENVPSERIKSHVIHLKDCDPVATQFMDIYEQKSRLAKEKHAKCYHAFVEEFVRTKIHQDVSRTFDEKLKAYQAHLHAQKQLENRKKQAAEKAAKAKRLNDIQMRINSSQPIKKADKQANTL